MNTCREGVCLEGSQGEASGALPFGVSPGPWGLSAGWCLSKAEPSREPDRCPPCPPKNGAAALAPHAAGPDLCPQEPGPRSVESWCQRRAPPPSSLHSLFSQHIL